MRIDVWLITASAAAFLLAAPVGAQQNATDSPQSGFLGNAYSLLQEVQTPSGLPVKRWIAPEVKPGTYESILIEPNVFYPQPQSTKQVTAQTLQDINAYFNESVKRELTGLYKFASEPGPKTLRLRTAITSVAVKDTGLKPYQLLPIAFIVTGGKTSKAASIAAEYEMQDTETGKVVMVGMRQSTGVELKSATQPLTLADVKPVIDVWAKDLRALIEAARQRK